MRVVAPREHSGHLSPTMTVVPFDNPKRGVASLWRMARVFLAQRRSFRPDIYMFHSTFALAGLVILRILGDRRPALYCPHGWAVGTVQRGSWKARVIRSVEGSLSGLATVVINVSKAERDLAQSLRYRGRQAVIENAVPDLDRVPSSDQFDRTDGAIHLVFVGRFDRQKGLDILLPAFAEARRSRPDLRLHIVGAAVRDVASEFRLPEGAALAGWVGADRIDDFYRSADALIVPSRWEGLPLVIPEALRNGTPVLVSEQSGMADLIRAGKTGESFALDVDTIADLLCKLDREKLAAMRPACRADYLSRYAMPRLLTELETIFREIAAP